MNKRLNRALRRAILSLSVIPGAVEESVNREGEFDGVQLSRVTKRFDLRPLNVQPITSRKQLEILRLRSACIRMTDRLKIPPKPARDQKDLCLFAARE